MVEKNPAKDLLLIGGLFAINTLHKACILTIGGLSLLNERLKRNPEGR